MAYFSCTDSAISTNKSKSYKPTSMSSFSLESGVGAASTSGCSSLWDPNQQKTLKKQRVKQCLEELKSLIKPGKGRGKSGGTLDTLQNVISQMKKYRDVEDATLNAPDMIDSEMMGSTSEGDGIDWPLSVNQALDRGNWFKVVMSMKENCVLQVPHDLLRMLRYPHNYWFNQSLMDYIYKRDVVTVNTQLAMSRMQPKQMAAPSLNENPTATEQKNIFFFRIRHYKSIRHGFSLNRSEKYTVFCGQVSRQKVVFNFPIGTPVEGFQADHTYPVLECTPIQSAYKKPGILPHPPTFLMRHTVHGNYIFLHPSSIPLTGYLPQEVVGSSIFDYYHPQDLLILLGIYQQIVSMPGKTFRSVPYRMRVKNGDYIRLETEWSSFVNPWTNRIDFIICKNHVLDGPTNLDVFNESPSSKRQNQELSAQARSLQRHIRSTLLQPMNSCHARYCRVRRPMNSCRARCRRVRRNVQQPTDTEPIPIPTPAQVRQTAPAEHVKVSSEGMASDTAPPNKQVEVPQPDDDRSELNKSCTILENEKLLIYEQLNYAQNIRRFLLSCSISLQGKSSSENNTESDASDQEDITVDLTLPKPPSFASSTKALVSEREHLEEMPSSPTPLDLPDMSSTSTCDDVYQPIPLTEEVVNLHNRQQRQQYIEKMVREKTNLGSVQGQGLKIVKESGKAKKRTHAKETDEDQHATKTSRMELLGSKWSQTDPSQLLYPLKPVNEKKQLGGATLQHATLQDATLQQSCSAKSPFCSPSLPRQRPPGPASAPTYVSVSNMPSMGQGLVFCQGVTHGSKQHLVTVQSMTHSKQDQHLVLRNPPNTNVGSIPVAQWPFISPTSLQRPRMSYVPQIMYQPIPGAYFSPITPQPMIGGVCAPVKAAQGTQSKQSSSDMEEISSTGSKEIVDKDEAGKNASKKSSEGSDTNQSFEDSSSSMMYLLESANNSSLSESDDQQNKSSSRFNKMASPWKANVHWSTALEMNFKMPSANLQQVLKSDRMFLQKMQQPAQVLEQAQQLAEESSANDCVLLDDDNLLGTNLTGTEQLDAESKTDEQKMNPGAATAGDPISGLDKNEKIADESDSSDDISKDSGEISSDLTPSDQRSQNEQASSAKESDQASSSDNGIIPPPKGQNKQLGCEEMLAKVFVPLRYKRQKLSKSAWLQNTSFDVSVQMQYNKPQLTDVKQVLADDQAQLEDMSQPEMVHNQLDELMVQLKSHIIQALTPLSPREEMDMEEGSENTWGDKAQSSTASTDGRLFPYSSGDSEMNNDIGDSQNIDEPIVEASLIIKDIDGDDDKMHSDERNSPTIEADSVGNSPAGCHMRNNREGANSEITDFVTDIGSSSEGSRLPSMCERSGFGIEKRLASSSEEDRQSSLSDHQSSNSLQTDSLPIASSASSCGTHDRAASDNSWGSNQQSVSTCCSPQILIDEMGSNKSEEYSSSVKGGSSQQETDSDEKESVALMLKDLFTSEEGQLVIPE